MANRLEAAPSSDTGSGQEKWVSDKLDEMRDAVAAEPRLEKAYNDLIDRVKNYGEESRFETRLREGVTRFHAPEYETPEETERRRAKKFEQGREVAHVQAMEAIRNFAKLSQQLKQSTKWWDGPDGVMSSGTKEFRARSRDFITDTLLVLETEEEANKKGRAA